jgi:mono/diheme cytochrome c family protein
MRRTWLGVVFAGMAVAAFICGESGSARAQQAVTQTDTMQTAQPAPVAAEPAPAEAAAPSPCAAVDAQALSGILSAVPRYGSTWVLIVPQRLAETIPNATAPGVKTLHVGVMAGTVAGDVARAIGITNIEEAPFNASAPSQLLADVRDGKLDAAVMWAPLAGLGILNLGLDGLVSVYTVDKPHAAPASMHAAPVAASDPCVIGIAEELDVSGTLPAELLASVEIRDLLDRRPPKTDIAQARQGGVLFNTTCARCHGVDAVADPHGLAPVDLRLSIRRFSYPGFHYIVLNGRPQKSMPPFRGTLTDEQIPLIYQYLRARSNNALPATQATPAGSAR